MGLLTGAATIGLEIQPRLVHAARELAESLHLDRARFVVADASERTRLVLFLYCRFGSRRVAMCFRPARRSRASR